MFSRTLRLVNITATQNGVKNFSTTAGRNFKVVVVGAAGGIGQPLSLLLKLNELVTHLALVDVAKVTPGVAADISHIDACGEVTGHVGPDGMCAAFVGAHVIVVPAGVPRKPGMSRDDLFNTNASIVRDIAATMAQQCPQAMLCIITNPVNSVVPIASEVLKKAGVYDPRRVFGVTTLDIVRSRRFIGEVNCIDPQSVNIPVIGGHSGITIIPLLSQSRPPVCLFTQPEIDKLTVRIQEAGTEVVKAKAGGGSATLSMGYAGARFAGSVLKGLAGESNVVECAYVKSDMGKAEYFATPIILGRNGMECTLGIGCLNPYEHQLLEAAMPELVKNIETGKKFVQTGGKTTGKAKKKGK